MDDQTKTPEPLAGPASTPIPSPVTAAQPTSPATGSTIEPGTPTAAPSPASSEPATPPSVGAPKKKKGRSFLLLLLVLLLAAGAGAGWWFFIRDDSKTAQKAAVVKKDIPSLVASVYDTDPSVLYPDDVIGSFDISQQIFEGLVGYDNNDIVPRLATKWVNPDESTWEIQLKKGVKFHTGREMKASDVKASIDFVKEAEYYGTLVSHISEVTAVDDYTVRIKTAKPDALLLRRLSYVYIIDTEASDDLLTIQRGTGPYTLKAGTEPTSEVLVLSPFDDYHQGRPRVRELTFKYYEDFESTLEDAKKGAVDAISIRPFKEQADAYTELGYQHVAYESPGSYGIRLNTERSGAPFTNKDLRKAVSLALDKKKIIEEVGYSVAVTALSQTVPISTTGYVSTIAEDKQDLKEVKALMTKANYTNAPIKVLYSSAAQLDVPVVVEQLKAAGFNIVTTDLDTPKDLLSRWTTGEYDIVASSYYSDLTDGADVLRGIIDKEISGVSSFTDADLLEKLDEADAEFDSKKRVQLLQEVNQGYYDVTAWVPTRTVGVSNFIKPGIKTQTDFSNAGFGIYFWKAYQE